MIYYRYGLNVCVPPPQNAHVKTLLPDVMVVEVGPLEVLRVEPMKGINTLISQESLSALLCSPSREDTSWQLASGRSCSPELKPDLSLTPSRIARNKSVIYKPPTMFGILL